MKGAVEGPRRKKPKIVIVVDSSAESQAALRWALAEAARRECRMMALSVIDPDRRSDWSLERDPQAEVYAEQDRLADRVSRAMADAARHNPRRPPPIALVVRQGNLCREVARAAEGADVLVLGRTLFRDISPQIHELLDACRVVPTDAEDGAVACLV